MASYIDLNDLGSFANIEALWAAYPEGGQEGDYCTIDGVKYRWDKYDRMWVADPNFGPTPARSMTTFDGDVNMQNNLTVAGYIRAKGIKQPCLGLFLTEAALKAKWPEPEVGMWALVGENFPATVYVCEANGEWTETEATGGPDDVDLSSIVINGIKGWVPIDSISDLPSDPTEDEKSKGYLLGTTLYIWDGTEETFKSAELKGADGQDGQDGAPGPQGPKGESGVHLGDVVLVNDLTTGGEESALTAEMGKLIGGVLYGTNENLFDKDDPTNGQISYFGRTLSHKIYISSRTFYAKGIIALLTYNANNTQLTATISTASSGGAMRKFTIADDVDFAYIRVGYTDTTFVADNENVVNNYYYGNYCEKLIDSISPKYFNIIDPTADGFGVDTIYGYTLSNMLFVKDVEVITLKGVVFYEFYDENLTAIRHGQASSLTKILRIQPSGAYWLRVGCSTIAQLEDSFVALFDITLNVDIPTMGEFVPFVLSEINKTSHYNGTKIAVGGDSIAHGYNDETTLGGWSGRLANALGATLTSYTYPGSSVCKRVALPEMDTYSLVERSKQIAESSDEYSAILLAYGTNDFGNSTPISPLADVIATNEDEYNFTSALYYSLKRIIDAKPSANLYIVNILARTNNSPNDANAYNSMLEEVANYFALPILDVRHNCGINPNIPSMATAYMPDGLHPNGAGYEKIAKYIVQSIKDWVL